MTKEQASQKLTRPLLAVLLFVGCGLILPQGALAQQKATAITFRPETIQAWKDYIKNYPAVLARFQREQAERRQAAQPVTVSEEKNMDDLAKTYPFLQEDIKKTKEIQQTILDNVKKNPPPPGPALLIAQDVSTRMQVAEIEDKELGMKFLFVYKSGRIWCGMQGCNMMVYVDQGSGYKEATGFITGGMYISKVGKQVSLFAGSPQKEEVVEWILKDGKFVKNIPPPPEPASQDFLEWKAEQQQAGKWPPQ